MSVILLMTDDGRMRKNNVVVNAFRRALILSDCGGNLARGYRDRPTAQPTFSRAQKSRNVRRAQTSWEPPPTAAHCTNRWNRNVAPSTGCSWWNTNITALSATSNRCVVAIFFFFIYCIFFYIFITLFFRVFCPRFHVVCPVEKKKKIKNASLVVFHTAVVDVASSIESLTVSTGFSERVGKTRIVNRTRTAVVRGPKTAFIFQCFVQNYSITNISSVRRILLWTTVRQKKVVR